MAFESKNTKIAQAVKETIEEKKKQQLLNQIS